MWKKITDVVSLEDYKNKKDSVAEPLGGIGQRVYLPNELVIGCPTGLCGNDPERKGQPYLDAGCPVHRDVALSAVNKHGVEVVDTKNPSAFQGLPPGTKEDAMSRHPAGTALDGSGEDLPNNVLPFKHKGNIMEDISKKRVMSNEFNERTASASAGLWDDEDDFEKEAGMAEHNQTVQNAINAAGGQQNTGLWSAVKNEVINNQSDKLLAAGVKDEKHLSLAEAKQLMGMTPKPKNPKIHPHADHHGTAGHGSGHKPPPQHHQGSVEELPEWIQNAIKLGGMYDDPESMNEDLKLEQGREEQSFVPSKECALCGNSENEHCSGCAKCPGDNFVHDKECPGDGGEDQEPDINEQYEWESSMGSAGLGTDEDYGYYG